MNSKLDGTRPKATFVLSTLTRRAATTVVCALGLFGVAGCVTTLPGTAGHAPGPVVDQQPDTTTSDAAQQSLKDQCATALTSAKGFLESWKALATAAVPPNAQQRSELAAVVQGNIDQLNAQLPTILDAGLVSHVQSIVAEMNTIVSGLKSGIAVELSAYSAAVNATTQYCK